MKKLVIVLFLFLFLMRFTNAELVKCSDLKLYPYCDYTFYIQNSKMCPREQCAECISLGTSCDMSRVANCCGASICKDSVCVACPAGYANTDDNKCVSIIPPEQISPNPPQIPEAKDCSPDSKILEYSYCVCNGMRINVYYDNCLGKWYDANMKDDSSCSGCFYTTNCPQNTCIDNDEDGYGQNCLRGPDCDDNNRATHNCVVQLPPPPASDKKIFHLVFVPIQVNSATETFAYREIAEGIFNDFLTKSPFKECPDIDQRVKAIYLTPEDCAADCDTACTLYPGFSGTVSCIDAAKDCAKKKGVYYDRVVGIVNKAVYYGACAEGSTMPTGASVGINSFNGADLRRTYGLHELGHTLGLCHSAPEGDSCWLTNNDNTLCPNTIETNWDSATCLMDNCNEGSGVYCEKAYNYLKTVSLAPWLQGCG